MKLTRQQALILFDITKGCLYSTETQFAGYSKEEIMKLLNQIISQQDNEELLELEDDDFLKNIITKPGYLYEIGKVENISKSDPNHGLQDITHEVFKNITDTDEDFWDD